MSKLRKYGNCWLIGEMMHLNATELIVVICALNAMFVLGAVAGVTMGRKEKDE